MRSRVVNWEVAQVNNHFTHQRARCKFYLGHWQSSLVWGIDSLAVRGAPCTLHVVWVHLFPPQPSLYHIWSYFTWHLSLYTVIITFKFFALTTPLFSASFGFFRLNSNQTLASTQLPTCHSYSIQTVSLFYCRMIGPLIFSTNRIFVLLSYDWSTHIQYKPYLCSTAVWLVHSCPIQTISLLYCRMIGPLMPNTNHLFVLLSYDFAKIPHNLLLLVG